MFTKSYSKNTQSAVRLKKEQLSLQVVIRFKRR